MEKLKISKEYRDLVPRLSEKEYSRLEQSIKEEGVRDSLVINSEKTILDGYTRYEIALKHNKEFKTIIRSFTDKFEEKEFVIKVNLERRHLNLYQRGCLGLGFREIETERAKDRQATSGKGIYGGKPLTAKLPEGVLGEARNIAAKEVGISGRTLDKVEKIEEKATPEQKEKLINGEESVNAVYQQITKTETKDAKLKTRKSSVLPEGIFNVIYADCPWQYDNKIAKWGAAEIHYETKSTEGLCKMEIPVEKRPDNIQAKAVLTKIKDLADKNSALFLWATNPFLEDALGVVRAWGFGYKSNIVWVKTNLKKPGSGFYIRGRHELLFICIRGSFVPDQRGKTPIGSVVEADVEEHSKKPEIFYDIIEKIYPDAKYLELFARKKRKGWTSWGDEVDA